MAQWGNNYDESDEYYILLGNMLKPLRIALFKNSQYPETYIAASGILCELLSCENLKPIIAHELVIEAKRRLKQILEQRPDFNDKKRQSISRMISELNKIKTRRQKTQITETTKILKKDKEQQKKEKS
jgi:hypothetical protein